LVKNSFESVALVVGKMNQVVGRKLGMDDFPHGEPPQKGEDQKGNNHGSFTPAAYQEKEKHQTSRQDRGYLPRIGKGEKASRINSGDIARENERKGPFHDLKIRERWGEVNRGLRLPKEFVANLLS
jgi:hypothetical protein